SACRLRLVAVRVAENGRPRRIRNLLRSYSLARAGERAAFGEQHHESCRSESSQCKSVAESGGRTDISRHPEQLASAAWSVVQLLYHAKEYAECILRTGELRYRAAARSEEHFRSRL